MALHLAPGQPRTLAYSSAIRKDVKLLEVDEELLAELLQTGLCLKGAPGEEAVLCSSSKTFAVKTVETSNLVLLVHEEQPAAVEAPLEALCSHDTNLPVATPPGMLRGLATQLLKNSTAAQHAPVCASALVSSHLELVPAAPRLHQLDALLGEHRYGVDGEEEQGEGGGEGAAGEMLVDPPCSGGSGGVSGCSSRGLTEGQLLQRMQCSAAELRAALQDRRALCIDGRYCSVDAGYQGMLLELVLLTAVERGWPLHAVPGSHMAAALAAHGYDPRLTLHCLETFGSPHGDSGAAGCGSTPAAGGGPAAMDTSSDAGGAGDGGSCYSLDESLVCLHFARGLLLAQPDWELASFEREWGRRVPEGMLPSLEMLKGEARQYGGGAGAAGLQHPRRIKHFPLGSLPQDAPTRFAALFAEQQRWEWEDLSPYVQTLRGPGQTAEALLLKYARGSQQRPTDPVTYSAR